MTLVIQTSRAKAKRIKIDGLLRDPLDSGIQCEHPYRVFIDGRPDPVRLAVGIDPDRAVLTEVDAPCRKCSTCLAIRSKRWAARAAAEIAMAHRTWFGTLTWGDARERIKALARRDARNSGHGDWEAIPSERQTAFLWKQCGPDVTLYLKRVRKEAGTAFRYCAIVEPHKDAFPHVHMLLHEHGAEIRKRTLDGQWRVGFSQWRLVETGQVSAAWYVAKYLAKHSAARVRASGSYGRGVNRSRRSLPDYTSSEARESKTPSLNERSE